MAKKTTNKKVNVIKEEKDKEVSLDIEKTENVENTILDAEKDEDTENTILNVEKKDSDIIKNALEGNISNAINEDAQKPTTTSEEKVEETKPIEDNSKIDDATIYEKISESAKIGKGKEIEDSQNNKQNSANKVKTDKRKISKLFGYYWNGQMME